MIDGKARLVAENLCDGLGNCLGQCPKGAITVEQRPAEEFDETAVQVHLAENNPHAAESDLYTSRHSDELPCGCPGIAMRKLNAESARQSETWEGPSRTSQLGQWPVQLELLPAGGNIWRDADVLIAADCVAFAMPDFHERLLRGKVLAVACPKLDDAGPYVAKLAAVFADGGVKSVTIARMEVPCCGGLTQIVRRAMAEAAVEIPITTVVVGAEGQIVSVNGLQVA